MLKRESPRSVRHGLAIKLFAGLMLSAALLAALGCGGPADGTNVRPGGTGSGQTPKDTSVKPPKPDLG